MKTIEEIEQLAEKDFNDRQKIGHYELSDLKSRDYYYDGFCNGYTQCQEDMLKILKEEIKRAFIYGQGNAQMMEAGLERDEIEEYVNYRMISLNKQN
jgi:hypothetical protein